ncbi:MAG TPA: beta-ketoacyl synthase N-terminal-like domain-containing protein [Flavobacterium sp.]|nr:beta-ketoacyl synthase N-terminal-like domain-containing protein [Flavobacterium sp.]
MTTPVSLTAIASVSALGATYDEVMTAYREGRHRFSLSGPEATYAAPLTAEGREAVERIRLSDPKYKSLDDSVLFALLVARKAAASAGWTDGCFGINIGSSRGATGVFETHHKEFLTTGKTSPLASPVTTLGNIASWVSHDLGSSGPDISHSITCSTALHAVLNGIAWIRGGMADRFLAGGSEAPLTPFTLAQMKAMKIYSKEEGVYPCRALDFTKTANSMVLGEGAAVCCLERGVQPNALAHITGYGYATELLEHNASLSAEATCFQRSMRMALEGIDPASVDAIVMHAPGTKRGDRAEKAAIDQVFGAQTPLLTGNKWMVGHTFGASGLLSLEMAVMMVRSNAFFSVPFLTQSQDRDIRRVLVNAVGFGGNAVSLVVDRVL